jgi:hypothetical protein
MQKRKYRNGIIDFFVSLEDERSNSTKLLENLIKVFSESDASFNKYKGLTADAELGEIYVLKNTGVKNKIPFVDYSHIIYLTEKDEYYFFVHLPVHKKLGYVENYAFKYKAKKLSKKIRNDLKTIIYVDNVTFADEIIFEKDLPNFELMNVKTRSYIKK